MNYNPFIFAADFSSSWELQQFISPIVSNLGLIKIGLQLFCSEGPEILDKIPLPVMLDLKLHDIPNTVAQTVRALAFHPNIKFLTVHCLGGPEMLQAAVKAVEGSDCQIVGVTVLSSLDKNSMRTLQLPEFPDYYASWLIGMAKQVGVNTFVCSPKEVKILKQMDPKIKLIVPGIRLEGNNHDQKRTGTPGDALADGADYIVLGRALREAFDPKTILENLSLTSI